MDRYLDLHVMLVHLEIHLSLSLINIHVVHLDELIQPGFNYTLQLIP